MLPDSPCFRAWSRKRRIDLRPEAALTSENTVYAIIEDSGTQIMVREGDVIEVDLREETPDTGSTLVFDRVLAIGGESAAVGTPYVGGASVSAEVLGEIKGDKVIKVMYKRRKGMRRKSGHRQRYLSVRIGAITGG
jgi:large subunit ribosomal protein L21